MSYTTTPRERRVLRFRAEQPAMYDTCLGRSTQHQTAPACLQDLLAILAPLTEREEGLVRDCVAEIYDLPDAKDTYTDD